MIIKKNFYVLILVLLFLTGCGNEVTSGTYTEVAKKGYVIDAPVVNLTYTCGSKTAKTTTGGLFICPTLPVSFSVGGLKLGTLNSLNADSNVYVQDIVKINRNDFNNTELIKLGVFLQSLDKDKNNNNEILIDDTIIFPSDKTFSEMNLTEVQALLTAQNIVPVTATEAAQHLREFSLLDTLAPVITLKGEANVTVHQGNSYEDAGVTVKDDRDSNVELNTTGKVDSSKVGIYTILYTAKDASGNIGKISRTVNVIDKTAPTLTISDNKSESLGAILDDKGQWVADSVIFTFSFSEAITGFDISDIKVSGGVKGVFSGSGDSYTLEVIPLTANTPVVVNVAENVAQDIANNSNTVASEAVQVVNTEKAFITTWKTDNEGLSNDNQIALTIQKSEFYDANYTVDWGDGEVQKAISDDVNHTYNSAGVYTVKITGSFPGMYFTYTEGEQSDSKKLIALEQWGSTPWISMKQAFSDCQNLVFDAIDNPNLTNVSSMSYMFASATSFNQDIGDWNVSDVDDMSYMFASATAFNQDIGDWNVSSVDNMSYMFASAIAFNQDIGDWNVSFVDNMSYMFASATAFNQDIGAWDVSFVSNMSSMFASATAFNQDIGDWDMSFVDNMSSMFADATVFNQDIGDWDVSSVFNMSSMFASATAFNQDIGAWDVSFVDNMSSMFVVATAFNQDIGAWDVSDVSDMSYMFANTIAFNQDIGAWDVSFVEDMSYMFAFATAFNQDLVGWDVSYVTNMEGMFFLSTSFQNHDLSGWDVSTVTVHTDFVDAENLTIIEPLWNE